MTFLHYSPLALTVLDPKYYGRGPFRGRERARKTLKQVCLYSESGEVERELRGLVRHEVQIDGARLYNLSKDSLGLLSARTFYGTELRVKRLGYLGYWLPSGLGVFKGQARIFHPVAVAKRKG